jgi:hypothetical protein
VLRLPQTCLLCSRYGQRVYAYYTLAWFDRYLKGPDDQRIGRDALARLTATTFDGSADVSAIDMGTFVPGVGNRPVTIDGLSVVDRLSFTGPRDGGLARAGRSNARTCGLGSGPASATHLPALAGNRDVATWQDAVSLTEGSATSAEPRGGRLGGQVLYGGWPGYSPAAMLDSRASARSDGLPGSAW